MSQKMEISLSKPLHSTTDARLAPGCTVEYSTTLLNLISCNCCTCVQWVYSVVQLGLSHNNFCKYTGRKQSRMDRFQNKINGTHLVGAPVYSVVQLGLGHGHTNKTCQTPLPSTVELRLHPSSLPHPNPLLSSLGLRPKPFLATPHSTYKISHATKNN
jgi:hypothetical protein